jgi:hypothetical protein
MRDNAQGAEDRFFLPRAPNLLGAVHLELYELEEALRLNLGEEAGRGFTPRPEPLAHSLLKVGTGPFGARATFKGGRIIFSSDR